ncbi:MAG: hypothetical protein ACYDCO_12685 [Armatimonadota bacterium]
MMDDNASQLKQDYQSLFRQLRDILLAEDPIGIYYDINPDEYDPEIGSILPRLKNCKSVADMHDVVYQDFVRWFGPRTAGAKERYQRIAERIWSLTARTSDTPPDLLP